LKIISFPKGVIVTGIIREGHVMIASGKDVIDPGDRIIIFAKKQAIPKLEKNSPGQTEIFLIYWRLALKVG
jgi:trk system potassium uptake protein TrkA